MRRTAVIITALVALLAASAALAATKSYEGKIKGDPKSEVVLKVEKRGNGDREVKSFAAKDFLISCRTGEARLERAMITGSIPVNDRGRFKVKGTSGDQELKVEGKLKGKRRAKGTVRYRGPTVVDGERQDCSSGELDWVARR